MLKKAIITIFIFFLVAPLFSDAQGKPTVIVFFSPHCGVCLKLKAEILPKLEEKYQGKVDWLELNIYNPQNLGLLNSLSEQFRHEKALVPSVFVGDTFLVGFKEIKENLERTIESSLGKKTSLSAFLKTDLFKLFEKISILAIMGSGLADGINPCAFAVIVFFVSFLGVYGYRKKEIIYVGTFYCLAVFITYLLLGLGFFKFIYSFKETYLFIKSFYYFVAFFCFLMGLLSLYDYFKLRKTGESEQTILQLPKFFKKRINIVIGSRMREKKYPGVGSLIITSFIVGFLVSLLEAVCTGQVYVPTIVFILKNASLRLKALTYLLLYNLMFIFPLAVIFLLSLIGVSSLKFNNFLKRNLGKIKIIMAFVFFALGGFILGLR